MFRIGEFSRLSRVSVKMLRHYDELGLLRPAHVDPQTGYRYYLAEQLPRLHRLIALKDLGFSLDQVGLLLSERVPLSALRGMLEERRLAIEQEVVRQRARLSAVESRLAAVEEGESGGPVIDVVVRPVAPQLVAAIRTRVEEPGTVTALFEELEREVARQGARAAGPPALVLHDADYRECGLGVEVAVPLERPVRPTGRVACCELPGAERMACAMHSGGYAEIDRAAAALLLWAERSGLAPAGPLREVYLRFGADDSLGLPPLFLAATADEYLTELQLPVAPSPR